MGKAKKGKKSNLVKKSENTKKKPTKREREVEEEEVDNDYASDDGANDSDEDIADSTGDEDEDEEDEADVNDSEEDEEDDENQGSEKAEKVKGKGRKKEILRKVKKSGKGKIEKKIGFSSDNRAKICDVSVSLNEFAKDKFILGDRYSMQLKNVHVNQGKSPYSFEALVFTREPNVEQGKEGKGKKPVPFVWNYPSRLVMALAKGMVGLVGPKTMTSLLNEYKNA